MLQENILPIIMGSQLIAVNKPGTPYQPLVKMLLSLITGRKTVEVPVAPGTPGTPLTPSVPSSILTMLIPFIQQLSNKPPVATVVPPPAPSTIPTDPNLLIEWLMKLINSPEVPVVQPSPNNDKPVPSDPHVLPKDARWEHFIGCFHAMVELYPNVDISAVSKNGNW